MHCFYNHLTSPHAALEEELDDFVVTLPRRDGKGRRAAAVLIHVDARGTGAYVRLSEGWV